MEAVKTEITPKNTAGILLAAGAARRFGGDKLSAEIEGRSVLDRSASALRHAGCFINAGVIARKKDCHQKILDSSNLSTLINENASSGVSGSIKLGVQWAVERGAKAILIALADMPFLPPQHFHKLFRAADNEEKIAFTICVGVRMPPALFGEQWFERLLTLSGDQGAKILLRDVPAHASVEATKRMLTDIDVIADLGFKK
ncbi:nucleotidyltransferase family protein [Hyphococcus sp.]|uniref:nucleotidyltransferase family protein n=1 Tax=Hyphococcus sp. TaxID=2038636 RepID=UPI0020892E5E|nr:MAG: hypothetical protein DHS20C04_06150 [Marinicaulis sp.]